MGATLTGPGEARADAWMRSLLARLDALEAATRNPAAVYFRAEQRTSPGQSIPHTGLHVVLFETEVEDSLGLYNAATGVFTADRAGVWLFSSQMLWVVNSGGSNRQFIFSRTTDASGIFGVDNVPPLSTSSPRGGSSTPIRLTKGETVRVFANQNSGAALQLDASGGTGYPAFSGVFVGR